MVAQAEPNALAIVAGTGPNALSYFASVDTPGPVGVAGTDGVQTVAIAGAPTGGTLTLTWNGYTTTVLTLGSSLPTTAAVQAALNALPGGSTITVAGTPGVTYAITVPKLLPQTLITASATFVGGTNPAVTVTNTTPGTQSTNPGSGLIPVSFKSPGWCDTSGLIAGANETSTKIGGYGTTQTLRTIISQSERTFDVVFQESNTITTALYARLPLSSVVADASGYFRIAVGAPSNQNYAGIFDIIDGLNHIRAYCPRLQVSAIKSRTAAGTVPFNYGITFTAVPDTAGNTVYEDYNIAALAA